MRQWIAIFVAAGLVAATLPFVRGQNESLLDLLSKAKSAVIGDDEPSAATLDPPALQGVD